MSCVRLTGRTNSIKFRQQQWNTVWQSSQRMTTYILTYIYWKTPQFAGSFRPAEDLFCLVHNFITKSQKPLIFSKIVQLFEFSRLFWAKIQITGTIFWNQHPLPFFAGTPFQFSAFCIFFSSKIHRFYVIVDLLSIYFNCVSIALLRRNNQHVNLCIWINIVIIT